MANNSFKIKKSINIEPLASPTLNAEGDIGMNSTSHKLEVRDNSATRSVVTEDGTATLTNKTFDADGTGNSITNIENADIKAAAAIALDKLAATTASRALVSDASGFVTAATTTSTEIGYVNGVTSAIQTQLNTKITASSSDTLTNKSIDADANTITNIENADIKAAAAIALDKLAATTASRALVSDASGFVSAATTTSTEIGYVNGVTSSIQTQLDGKIAKTLTTTTGDMIYASSANTPARLPIGSAGQVLKTVGGVPAWATASSGGINYISSNPDAEADTAGWATYADAAGTDPVNGTGGSANITWTRSTSSPLRGTGSFLLTKDAANRQGEGVSFDFTIDSTDQAKALSISFDYIIGSGTFVAGTSSANSDLTVWIYDVTNTTLIQPSNIKLFSNSSTVSDKYSAQFQTASNSTSYRLIIHCASTSASAYTVKFDNFKLGPSEYVFGSPVTDWQSATPTFTGFGTPSNVSFNWRRVGGNMEVNFGFTSGTSTATPGKMSLPFTVDTSKLSTTANTVLNPIGYNANSPNILTVLAPTSNEAAVYFGLGTASATNTTPVNASSLISSGTTMNGTFSVPILGWSSSVQMSDSADTRVVAAKYTGVNTTTFTTSGVVADFNTKAHDTCGAVTTGASWKFTAPVSGIYRVSVGFYPNSTVGLNLTLRKNASNVFRLAQIAASATASEQSGATTIQLNSGDYIDIIGYTESSTTTFANDASLNYIDIERLSGPSAIAATETIAAKYRPSGSRTPTTSKAINYDTKVFDTHSAVTVASGDAAGWKFTAPAAGFYQVNLTFFTSSGAASTTYYIYKNGSSDTALASGVSAGVVGAAGLIQLNAGDYIDIRSDSTPTISNALTEISIIRAK